MELRSPLAARYGSTGVGWGHRPAAPLPAGLCVQARGERRLLPTRVREISAHFPPPSCLRGVPSPASPSCSHLHARALPDFHFVFKYPFPTRKSKAALDFLHPAFWWKSVIKNTMGNTPLFLQENVECSWFIYS